MFIHGFIVGIVTVLVLIVVGVVIAKQIAKSIKQGSNQHHALADAHRNNRGCKAIPRADRDDWPPPTTKEEEINRLLRTNG